MPSPHGHDLTSWDSFLTLGDSEATAATMPPQALKVASPWLPVPEGCVRIAGPYPLPAVLRDLGVDANELLASLGVAPDFLDDPDRPIAFTTLGRLLRAAAARTGVDHLGLLIGQRGGLTTLGLLGLLLQQEPDVGTALRELALYLHIHDRGAVVTFAVDGDMASLGYAIYAPGIEGADQIGVGAIAIGCNIMRDLCGPGWSATEVLLARRRPSDARPYQSFFRAPLRFDAEQYELVFPARWLSQPISGANAQLMTVLHEQVVGLAERGRDDVSAAVRRALRALLATGGCSVERVCALLAVHRRTLARRLRAQGTDFETLLAEVRYEAALQLLDSTDMALSQIAFALGYSEGTAFNRAFRRWSGKPPGEWRNQARASEGPE